MVGKIVNRARQIRRDQRGNVAILLAGALSTLVGATALAIDMGAIFLEERKLQGIVDAAALGSARASMLSDRATERAIAANESENESEPVRIVRIEAGNYSTARSIGVEERFTATATPENAVRVTLEREVPLHFGQLLTGRESTTIRAEAIAANINLAAFSIGSRLAGLDGGVVNSVLSGLASTELRLDVIDYEALASADIEILAFSTALGTALDLEGATIGETLEADIAVPVIVSALATAASDGSAANVMERIIPLLPATTIRLSDLIDPGPLAGTILGGNDDAIAVGALAMLRQVLTLASDDRQIEIDLGARAGIGSTRLWLAVGERAARSPWIAVSDRGEITVRTTQSRLYLDAGLADTGAFASIRLPVLVELAAAEATLESLRCPNGSDTAEATLSVTPSIGSARIADIDPAALDDFSSAPAHEKARVAHTPLTAVDASAAIMLCGTNAQKVSFTAADIASGTGKTVSTDDAVESIAASLADDMTLEPSVLGIAPSANAELEQLAGLLSGAAPALDEILAQLVSVLGIGLGQADVRVNAIRCGTPILVG